MNETRVRGDDVLANHRSYRECAGIWRSEVSMTITDAGEFWRSGIRLANRVSLRLMAISPAFLGRCLLCTTVAYDAGGEVPHTTAVRWLGVQVLQSARREHDVVTIRQNGPGFSGAQTLLRQRAA